MEKKVQKVNSKTNQRVNTKKIVFLFLIMVTVFFLTLSSIYLKKSENFLFQELQFSEERIKLLEKEIQFLKEETKFYLKENSSLKEENEILQNFFSLTTEVEITAYAPLCPEAITGWDYSGDPQITANGEKVVPGFTAAAGPNIPFGTYVLIEDIGLWQINDRGGRIGPQNIDIAVETSKEAREFGRQRLRAVFISEEEFALLQKSADILLKN